MPLLEFEHVSKQRRGWRALDDVSMAVDPGEMVTIFGERRSGRSTLLRIATGIETPDSGAVRFDGADLADHKGQVQAGIGYCRAKFRRDWGPTVLDQLLSGQHARRVAQPDALARALHALQRVDAGHLSALPIAELRAEEKLRVAIARALTAGSRLLILDEPTLGLDPLERDDVLGLLRRLANQGLSVLATTGTGTDFVGSDRVLSLGNGRLRGEVVPELAPVTDLRHHRRQTA